MAPPKINLDCLRANITLWARTNKSSAQIIEKLRQEHGIRVNSRTLERRLRDWQVRRRVITDDCPKLRAQIAILFRMNCSDDEMVTELVYCRYRINKTQVARLRKELGLLRRMGVLERK
jgi:hypothetical protein